MQLTAIALCKEVLFDKFSNTFSFIHVVERVRPAQYPFALTGLSLGMIFDIAQPVPLMALQVLCGLTGGTPAQVAVFQLANLETGPQKIHARLSEILLTAPGRHECSIFLNDGRAQRLLAVLPIYAEEPAPQKG